MIRIKKIITIALAFLLSSTLALESVYAAPLLISITNPPPTVTATAVGDTQFWPNAGTLGVGGTPISLRATLQSISAGDSIRLFTSGDNPVVRADTGTLAATVLWEVFDQATGLPIVGDPDFLITDIDGRNGTPIESVSAACAGLTSYTTNGNFLAGCNANTNNACESNIRVSESGGSILAEGTQGQNGNQQESYMQYSWTGVSDWTVSYFATTGGRWYVHDADGDVPFDGTRVDINLVDLATIKGVTPTSLTSPAQGELISFQIDLSNAGPAPATGANLTDLLPAGVSYQSHSATSGTYNPANGLWGGVNVAVNATETLIINALVTAPVGTSITNVTTTALASESICSSRDLLEYTFEVAQTPAPSLSIVKSVDPVTSFDQAGNSITYSYEVTNTGNVNIDNVVPTDLGPTFGSQAATNSLSAFTPTSATLTPGQSQTFTATYLLDQVDVDNLALDANPLMAIDNTASVTGMPVAGALAAVTPSMVETGFAPTPNLSVVKSVGTLTSFNKAGDTITYEYAVTNTGNITIDLVTPVDTGPTFNGMPATNSLSAFDPVSVSLAPMASQTFSATYLLDQADVNNMASSSTPLTAIENSASASGDPVGTTALPTIPNSTATTGFNLTPSLTVDKSVSAATTFSEAGDIITYQYVIENTGNVTINNVMPVDSGPTFNGQAGSNNLSAFSPLSATLDPSAPSNVQTFTATYQLSQEDVDNIAQSMTPSQAISNTATAQGDPVGGVLATVMPDTVQAGFAPLGSLALVKSAGVPSVGLGVNTSAVDGGDTIVYSFEVTNSGDTTISNVQINDLGVTFNSVPGTGTMSTITCPNTSLSPNQLTTCVGTYTLSQADVDNAIAGGVNAIQNSANVTGTDPNSANVTSPNSAASATITASSSVNIVKTAAAPTITQGADSTIVDPGDTVTFTIAVTNNGNTTLSNVSLSDSLTTLVCPATTDMGNSFANDGNDVLAVGDGVSCTAIYALTQPNLDAGEVMNTAQVAANDPTGAMINGSDTVTSGFTQKAAVNLLKTSTPLSANPMVGDLITYNFVLTNTGNVSLSAPQVIDARCQTPSSPLVRSSGYVSGDNGVVGEMEAGEAWEFECVYAIDGVDILAGEVANTATGSGTPPSGSGLTAPESMASNLVDAQQNISLSLIKTASLPSIANGTLAAVTDQGDVVDYTFDLENTGNVPLTNIVVTDPLITAAPNNGTIDCGMGAAVVASLNPGDTASCSASYVLQLNDINAGQVSNTATATSDAPMTATPVPAPQAQSSAIVSINPVAELGVVKSASALPSSFAEGSLITYQFEITNEGSVTINSVVPVDTGPTFNGNAGTNTLSAFNPVSADLDPGQSLIFSATYSVSQADIDSLSAAPDSLTAIDNTATASGAPVIGSLSPVSPSTVETGVALSPSFELIKTSTAPVLPVVGSEVVYTFALDNTGPLSISNPAVNDSRCTTPGALLSFANGYTSGDTGSVVGVLEPSETWLFECRYSLSQNDINQGTVQNSALASGQTPAGASIEDTSDTGNPGDGSAADNDPTNTPLVRTPSWTVTKSTSSSPVNAGDTLVYKFELDNTGNVSIANIAINDAKCSGLISLDSGDTNMDDVLDPNETWVYSCTSIGVTQTEINAGTVLNSVTVNGMPPSGSPALAPATASENTPIVRASTLSVVKTAAAPTVGFGVLPSVTDEGDTIEYMFEVENTGNVSVSSIQINDVGPSFGVPAAAGTGSFSSINCSLSSLEPNQTALCTGTYTLSQADIDAAIQGGANSITNSATAQGNPPAGIAGPTVSTPSSAAQSIQSEPEMRILKVAGSPTTANGIDPVLTDPGDGLTPADTIPFTITVENVGNTSLSNVQISDNLTAVSCNASAIPSGSAFVNGTGNLAVGDTVTCSATYPISQTDINDSQVVNTASVMAQDPSGAAVTGVVEATSAFTQKTSLQLDKTSSTLPPIPTPNVSTLTYTFNLTNTGNVTLSAAEVADPLCQSPASPLTRTNGYSSGDLNNNNVLDAGETWVLNCDYTVSLADINAGEVTNTAAATGTPPIDSGLDAPTTTASNLAEAGQNAGISLDKVAGMPTQSNTINSQVGDTVTYRFNIANTGNVSLTDIVLDDPLITAAPNNGAITCVRNTPLMPSFDPVADSLNPSDEIICTGVYTLTQTDIDSGAVNNTADVTATPPPTSPPSAPQLAMPEASSSSVAPIVADPQLQITKTAGAIPAAVVAGDSIIYTYRIENTGNVTIDAVEPVDVGPTFNGVSGTNALSTYTLSNPVAMPVPPTVPPTVPAPPLPTTAILAPGEFQEYTAVYQFSQVDLDNMAAAATPASAISNQATADGEPANGPGIVVTPDTAVTGVVSNPVLELVKTSIAPATIRAGALVTYNFSLSNTGNVTVSDVLINDVRCQIPASPLTFTSGYVSGDIGLQAGSLDVNETWMFSCQYALTQTDIDNGTVQNTAQAQGQDPGGITVIDDSDSGNAGDDTGAGNDPTNTELSRTPNWIVEKSTTSTPSSLAETLDYEFLITNTGNVSINTVNVIDPKCQTAPSLVAATDLGGDNVLSPAGDGGSPSAEQWLYTCTSMALIQGDLDAGRIDNTVQVTGIAPGGNPPQISDMVSTPISTSPSMSLVKAAGTSTLNQDGSFDQIFNFVLKNTGNVTLNGAAINDNIAAQFGTCLAQQVSTGAVSLNDVPPLLDSATPTLGSLASTTIASTSSLGVGDSVGVNGYTVRFNPNAAGCTFPSPAMNSATSTAGTLAAGPVMDVSDNGTDPDIGISNSPGQPTVFVAPSYAPQMGMSKSIGVPVQNDDGTLDLAFTLLIENTGNVDITNLSVTDDLVGQLGSAFSASPATVMNSGVLVAPVVSEILDAGIDNLALPAGNSGFDGSASSNIVNGSSYLGVGDRVQIVFTIRINPYAAGAPATLANTATVTGADPSGATTTDNSDSGSDPTNNPGGPGTPTPIAVPPLAPSLELIKNGTLNSDGTIDYEFTITNNGNINVNDVVLSDVLLNPISLPLALDADQDGDVDVVTRGTSVVITLSYSIKDTDITAGQVENTADVEGADPSGTIVMDDSDSGNLADDTGADDDPTVTSLTAPSIGIAKALQAGSPVDLGNGTYQVTYEFIVENTGAFDLSNVQVNDDLNSMINTPNVNNGSFANPVVSSSNNTLTPNPSFDGASIVELLSGADTLLVGESGLIELSFTFDPDVYFGPFLNQASATADGLNGNQVSDLSENGAVVNPSSDSATPFNIATPSTPITLGWFKASEIADGVLFQWDTEIEVSNAGFFLLYEDENGSWKTVDQNMIVAKGDSTKVQSYNFMAVGLDASRFKLVDVSVTGNRVEHGEFELGVAYGIRSNRQKTDWEKIEAESELKQQQRDEIKRQNMKQRLNQLKKTRPQAKNTGGETPSVFVKFIAALFSAIVPSAHAEDLATFSVSEPGLYRVTHEDLMLQGLDLRGISIDRINLLQANESWPLQVSGADQNNQFSSNSSVIFPAKGLQTLYTGENKYTLVLDDGEPKTILSDTRGIPENTAPASSYLAEESYAPQNKYTHLSPSENDSWYADRLQAIQGPVSKRVVLDIGEYSPSLNSSVASTSIARMPRLRPRLEVNVWGNSNLPGNGVTNPDHHVLVELNDQQVADAKFDGLHEFPIEASLSELRHGKNTVDITLPKDHGYQFDLVNLDRVSLYYPRKLNARDSGHSLVFESAWSFFKISQLASNDVTVIRLDNQRNAYLMTSRYEGPCRDGCAYFAGSISDNSDLYFVATEQGLKTPEIELSSSFTNIFNGDANYLIIAHPDFIDTPSRSLEIYADELRGRFESVDIVNVKDIYGQYSGHVVDAYAISTYIQDAYAERGTRRVLLVGDDIYDYHNNLGTKAKSFIPSIYVKIATNVNAVPSDAKYGDLDDDQVPDISVTRIPARTSSELDLIFSKRNNYLNNANNSTAIFAADKKDSSGYSFKMNSEESISKYFSNWAVSAVFLDDVSLSSGRQTLIDAFNQGASLVSYFGHSSTDRWSISGLFTGDDVVKLESDTRPTVITQWGCWNTFYVSPEQDSLAHRFLFENAGGAVTLMGASSFTKADAEKRMSDLLFPKLRDGMSIGDAVLSAKRELASETPYQLDVLLGWAVLGPDDFSINTQ